LTDASVSGTAREHGISVSESSVKEKAVNILELIRDDRLIEWSEPWPGMSAEGEDVTVEVTTRMRVSRCIAFERKYESLMSLRSEPRTDVELLEEFMTVHRAEPAGDE
jgi:hypothetical protein